MPTPTYRVETRSGPDGLIFKDVRYGYNTAPGETRGVLAYRRLVTHGSPNIYGNSAADLVQNYGSEEKYKAELACYEAFRESLGSSVQGGAGLAEMNESLQMIARRASQLYKAFKAAKRLRAGKALTDLKDAFRPPKGGWREYAKRTGGAYLEEHFGWAPLIQDVHDAIETLQNPIPKIRIQGSGSAQWSRLKTGGPYYAWLGGGKATMRCRSSAYVQLDNPNLHLASQLGLINPLSVAWELVPLSFLIDWFLPVGSFLESLTDFAGVTLLQPCHSVLMHADFNETYLMSDGTMLTAGSDYVDFERFASVSHPGVHMLPIFQRLSVSRALTACSLLTQQLKGH